MAAPKLLVLSLLLLPLLPEATAARASSDSDQRQPEYGGGDSNGTRLETEWSRHRHHHNRHHHHHHHRPHHRAQEEVKLKRMFVFGDSYADTGNNKPSDASSWKFPYGTTFPGYPSGRFSDGRVFTDLLASYLGLKSPVSYRMVKRVPSIHLLNGVNFAFGGTGVFDTLVSNPNMSVQIDYFEALITGPHVYSAADIHSSIALLTNSGNDYSAYMARNGSANTITDFIQQVVDRLSKNLKRIHALGVRKIVVAGLQPLGCLPENTYKFWFNDCSNEINMLVSYHNTLLEKAVAQLNNATGPSTFVMIDFFNAFSSILQGKENTSFTSPLKPCCMGVSSDYFCSDVAKNGTKMYTVCVDPSSSFFWDMAHPTQAGWHAVISAIGSNLKQL